MSLPQYPKYRDSDAVWLGALPAHWDVKALRYLTTCLDGKRVPLNSEQRADRLGAVPYWGANSVMGYVNEALFDETLILLGEDGAPFFDKTRSVAFLSQGPVWPNNHIHVLRPISIKSATFLVHALNATDFSGFIDGSTRDKLTQGQMSCIPLPWPPEFEQAAITTFLDRETAKIDGLIAEQEKLITLLAEKRQTTISHAVTKGLNPDVPMKDSGVAWLGEVPAHWEVCRLGSLFKEVAIPGNDDLPVLSVSIHDGVSDKELDENEMDRKVTRSDDRSKYKAVAPGDLTYNMMRAWQGGFGSVTVFGMVSPAYVVARPIRNFSTSIIEQQLRTPHAVTEIKRHSRGITDFRLRLYWEEFKTINVVLAPDDEQVAILAFLKEDSERIDALSNEAARGIALLKERRSALISAAVTGKIDVRHLVEAEAA